MVLLEGISGGVTAWGFGVCRRCRFYGSYLLGGTRLKHQLRVRAAGVFGDDRFRGAACGFAAVGVAFVEPAAFAGH